MCELYCAEDAIYVALEQRVEQTIDPQTILASGQLGQLRRDYGWDAPSQEVDHLAEFWRLGPLLREGTEIAAARYEQRRVNTASA